MSDVAEQVVGIVGLGAMGSGMAQSLLRAGFRVLGHDLGADQRAAAAEAGVEVVADLAALCAGTRTVLLSLPMAAHVEAVLVGETGLLSCAQPDTLVIDTSTSEPAVTRALSAQLAAAGHAMLDCPVSGGPVGALAGSMVMVIGGEQPALDRALPVVEALTAKWVHLGASGNGHVAKLINNLLCAAHLVTTAEAVALGKQAGLDPALLIKGLNAGSGRSAVSEVNFPKWVLNGGFDSGFTMGLMRKDLRLARQLIDDTGLAVPLSASVTDLWAASSESQLDGDDFNCIVKTTAYGEPS